MVEGEINTCTDLTWLKQPTTEAHKTHLRKALATYYIDEGILAKMNIQAKIPIRNLLPWLQEQDKCWTNVTLADCVTGNKCINGLNTFLGRIKKEYLDPELKT